MLKNIIFDIKQGHYNNFPKCCIAFYATFWGRLSDLSQLSSTTLKVWLKLIGDPYHKIINSDNIRWGRIPCPKCVLKDKLGIN